MPPRMPGGWPDAILGLGEGEGGQPLGRCCRCPKEAHESRATTMVKYGGRYYCKPCANLEAAAALSRQEA